jgi:ribosome maturation protein Sdo1
MNIVAREPIRKAFKEAFKVKADPSRSMDDQIEEAIEKVSADLRVPAHLVRAAVEEGD